MLRYMNRTGICTEEASSEAAWRCVPSLITRRTSARWGVEVEYRIGVRSRLAMRAVPWSLTGRVVGMGAPG